jgi:hypothetical protein
MEISPEDRLTEELENLKRLWQDHVLDNDDYVQAKSKLLRKHREGLLGAVGVDEREEKSAASTGEQMRAIACGDLTQDVCASGMIAADHVIEAMRGGAAAQQQAQGCV